MGPGGSSGGHFSGFLVFSFSLKDPDLPILSTSLCTVRITADRSRLTSNRCGLASTDLPSDVGRPLTNFCRVLPALSVDNQPRRLIANLQVAYLTICL